MVEHDRDHGWKQTPGVVAVPLGKDTRYVAGNLERHEGADARLVFEQDIQKRAALWDVAQLSAARFFGGAASHLASPTNLSRIICLARITTRTARPNRDRKEDVGVELAKGIVHPASRYMTNTRQVHRCNDFGRQRPPQVGGCVLGLAEHGLDEPVVWVRESIARHDRAPRALQAMQEQCPFAGAFEAANPVGKAPPNVQGERRHRLPTVYLGPAKGWRRGDGVPWDIRSAPSHRPDSDLNRPGAGRARRNHTRPVRADALPCPE